MSDQTTDLGTRRDLLRAGAAGALGLEHLLAADAPADDGPFIVKPYLQLGDAPGLAAKEQLVVLWHTNDRDADWKVEYRDQGSTTWQPAPRLTWARVAADSIPPHRVYRAT